MLIEFPLGVCVSVCGVCVWGGGGGGGGYERLDRSI